MNEDVIKQVFYNIVVKSKRWYSLEKCENYSSKIFQKKNSRLKKPASLAIRSHSANVTD